MLYQLPVGKLTEYGTVTNFKAGTVRGSKYPVYPRGVSEIQRPGYELIWLNQSLSCTGR